jgi:hypothetical protein
MKRSATALVVLAISIGMAAAQILPVSPIVTYSGICEPSGAVLLSDGKYLVANDQDDILRVYDRNAPDHPVIFNEEVDGDLGLDPDDEDQRVDFEGATWLGDTAYFIGSHSRSGKGNWRPSRQHLIAVSPSTAEITGQFDGLIALLEPLDNAALKPAIGPHGQKVEELAAENRGLNIEGLAASADSKSLIIGLRNPVPNGKAWLLRLTNAQTVASGDGQLGLEKLAGLELDGRGIRSIEYSPDRQSYVIVAGPTGKQSTNKTFTLYTWKEGAPKADEIANAAATFASLPEFTPEVIMIDDAGKTLHVLSDDGDRDTCETSPSFRGVDISLN